MFAGSARVTSVINTYEISLIIKSGKWRPVRVRTYAQYATLLDIFTFFLRKYSLSTRAQSTYIEYIVTHASTNVYFVGIFVTNISIYAILRLFLCL